jgi:hypothetical protein
MVDDLRTLRQTRRHWPSVVRMASQTLVSSRMRPGQGEDLFLGQAGLAGQAVKGGQQPIQFAVIGEQVVKKTRGFRGGQAADFLKHFSSCHAVNLALVAPGASKGNRQYAAPDGALFWGLMKLQRYRTAGAKFIR